MDTAPTLLAQPPTREPPPADPPPRAPLLPPTGATSTLALLSVSLGAVALVPATGLLLKGSVPAACILAVAGLLLAIPCIFFASLSIPRHHARGASTLIPVAGLAISTLAACLDLLQLVVFLLR